MFAETYAGFPPGLARDTWAPLGRVIIWRPFKPISLNIFNLGEGWRTFLRANVVTADNCRRNSSACGNKVYWHHISDYSSDVLASHIFWHPDDPPLSSGIVVLFQKYWPTSRPVFVLLFNRKFHKNQVTVHVFHTIRQKARAISTSKM